MEPYKKLAAIILLIPLYLSSALGQEKSPLVSGTVTISIIEGTFSCNLTVTEIPRISDYIFLLNAGMNIGYIKVPGNSKPLSFNKSYYDTIARESFGYYIRGDAGAKYIPTQLEFSYVGKFPVLSDTSNYQYHDWRGNIAFNGKTIRADGLQASWYPILFDLKKSESYHKVRYDIKINCDDCSSIYLNGHTLQMGPRGLFRNNNPSEMFLFAGSVEGEIYGSSVFFNTQLSEVQRRSFVSLTTDIKQFYERMLKIPFKDTTYFVQSTPVSRTNAWLFVSYPTIINVGHEQNSFKGYFTPTLTPSFQSFLSHELAHYYFGNLRVFNSELQNILNEGLAEFMSMKAMHAILPDSINNIRLTKKFERIKDEFPAIGAIRSEDDLNERNVYLYDYTPIIFIAINKEIGDRKMWEWIHLLINDKTSRTDYTYLLKNLSNVLQDEKKLLKIRRLYLESNDAYQNAKAVIANKP